MSEIFWSRYDIFIFIFITVIDFIIVGLEFDDEGKIISTLIFTLENHFCFN